MKPLRSQLQAHWHKTSNCSRNRKNNRLWPATLRNLIWLCKTPAKCQVCKRRDSISTMEAVNLHVSPNKVRLVAGAWARSICFKGPRAVMVQAWEKKLRPGKMERLHVSILNLHLIRPGSKSWLNSDLPRLLARYQTLRPTSNQDILTQCPLPHQAWSRALSASRNYQWRRSSARPPLDNTPPIVNLPRL